MNNELVSITTTCRHRILEIQMQLKDKEVLILTEKIDRLERSRQQTTKEMELLRKQISLLEDICPRDEVFILGGREKYP
jgi:hypothetical protein